MFFLIIDNQKNKLIITVFLKLKKRGIKTSLVYQVQKKIYMDHLEAETFKGCSKLASLGSKSLLPTTNNTTISFTFGNWALPYLKFLKKIGIAK